MNKSIPKVLYKPLCPILEMKKTRSSDVTTCHLVNGQSCHPVGRVGFEECKLRWHQEELFGTCCFLSGNHREHRSLLVIVEILPPFLFQWLCSFQIKLTKSSPEAHSYRKPGSRSQYNVPNMNQNQSHRISYQWYKSHNWLPESSRGGGMGTIYTWHLIFTSIKSYACHFGKCQ